MEVQTNLFGPKEIVKDKTEISAAHLGRLVKGLVYYTTISTLERLVEFSEGRVASEELDKLLKYNQEVGEFTKTKDLELTKELSC